MKKAADVLRSNDFSLNPITGLRFRTRFQEKTLEKLLIKPICLDNIFRQYLDIKCMISTIRKTNFTL